MEKWWEDTGGDEALAAAIHESRIAAGLSASSKSAFDGAGKNDIDEHDGQDLFNHGMEPM